MSLYMVETISMFRMRYLVDTSCPSYAEDSVVSQDLEDEFTQKHLDEVIVSTREVTKEEAERIYLADNGFALHRSLDDFIYKD